MELNICHLYPDLLNVYGDLGNILILKHRAEKRNIKVNIIDISINDDFNEYEIKLSLEENVNLKMKFDEPDDMISKIRKSLKKDEELNDRMSNCNSNNEFLLFLNNYKTNRNENNKIKAR